MNRNLIKKISRRLLTATMMAAAFVAAVTSTLSTSWINGPMRGAFIASATILALTTVLLVMHDNMVHSLGGQALGNPQPESPDKIELEQAVTHVSSRYSPNAVRYLFWSIAGLDSHLTRVDERAEIERDTLRITTELTLSIDDKYRNSARVSGDDCVQNNGSGIPTLLVPLIMTTKGRLLDGIQIRDASGTVLPSLSQYETRGLLAIIIYSLFLLARSQYGDEHGIDAIADPSADLNSDESTIMWGIITQYVCRVGFPVNSEKKKMSKQELISDLQTRLDSPKLTGHFGIEWLERIKSVCLGLAYNYVIIVEVPLPTSGNHIVAIYSHLLPITSARYDKKESWRKRLGLSSRQLDAPLSRALEAHSYHFQMQAEPGMYIYEQHLERQDTGEVITQHDLKLGGKQQYARAYYDDVRSNAHLYLRRQGNVHNNDYLNLRGIIAMAEIPPGILGSAAVLAILNMIIILFVAVTNIGLHTRLHVRTEGGAAVPAILLAVPGFVGAFIGNWTDRKLMLRSSLKAYVGLLSTMFLSFTTALLYLYNSYNNIPGVFTVSFAVGQAHWTSNGIWLAIALGSFILASYLMQELTVQSRYYLGRLRARVN
jgi:hypothetical protein